MNVVPYATRPGLTDLSRNHDVALAVTHLASQFFGLDTANVTFRGIADHTNAPQGSLTVALWDEGGENAYRHVTFASRFQGFVEVRSDRPMKDVIRRDMIGDLKAAWNLIRGFPAHLPVGASTRVGPCGGLQVELFPFL